jgi:hypothetical protein
MSVGGRLVLLNSVLTSLVMFMLSFFEVPKGVLGKIDYFRSQFFWQGSDYKKKYRLAKWEILFQPKEVGGLGIQNIDIQNKCLLSKWLFKLLNEDGLWQTLLRKKYLSRYTLTKVTSKPGDSHFWAGLMKVKDTFLNLGSFILKNGTQIRFWEDRWLGLQPLMTQYPSLYNIARKKNATVASVFETVPLNVSFQRALVGENLRLWHLLVLIVAQVELCGENDMFRWDLSVMGLFSVRSMYRALLNNNHVTYNKTLWSLKVPLKIKIFMWYLIRGVVLTKDNLLRHNWHGDSKCAFCHSDESIQHLFFACHYAQFMWRLDFWSMGFNQPRSVRHTFGNWLFGMPSKTKHLIISGVAAICWAIWISRNDLVFDKKPVLTYLQVLFRATHWFRTWADLHKQEEGIQIKEACRRLECTALQIFAQHGWRFTNRIAS